MLIWNKSHLRPRPYCNTVFPLPKVITLHIEYLVLIFCRHTRLNYHPPSFLMGENSNWAGNYNVQYWNPAWQNIVITEATTMAKAGYSGIMLDVVDAYTTPAVAAAEALAE